MLKGKNFHSSNNLKQFTESNDEGLSEKSLSDYGITKNQSSAFQKIASIPEETFNTYIEEKKQEIDNSVNELTDVLLNG